MRTSAVRAAATLGVTGAALAIAASVALARPHFTVAPAPEAAPTRLESAGPTLDTAVFAGGCFWGIEGVFEHVKGVLSATSGFAGGHTRSPSYEDVSSSTTGHAESVRVVFDPSQVSYGKLLQVFFSVHDPTELDRQGPDVGSQYRSIVFYHDPAQQRVAESYLAQLRASHTFRAPIVTEVRPLEAFYDAEAYHQHFMEHHPDSPYIIINDAPKLVLLKRAFPGLYRDSWQ